MNDIITRQNEEVTEITENLFDRWIAYLDVKSKRTETTYTNAIKQFMAYLQENGIKNPKREDIISYREYLEQEHKDTTVMLYLQAVKLFFQWTELEGLYPDVAKHVKAPTVEKYHKRDALTTSQIKEMLGEIDRDTLQGKRDYAILVLMITSGLRTQSVADADIEDLRNVNDGPVLFYRAKDKSKSKTTIYAKLADQTDKAIRDYLKARTESEGHKPDGKDPLFASISNRNSGERMTTRSISRVAKGRMLDVGIDSDRLTAHSCRHSAATINLRAGGTPEETMQMLGHKNLSTTMIYIEEMDRADNNSESRIAGAIFG